MAEKEKQVAKASADPSQPAQSGAATAPHLSDGKPPTVQLVDQAAVDREIDTYLKGVGISDAPGAPSTVLPAEHPLTAGLLRPMMELPFIFAANGTEYNGWVLESKEADELTKAWLHVLQRLLPASQSIDLLIAVTATVGVVGIKWSHYRRDVLLLEKPAEEKPGKPNGPEHAAK